MRHVEEKSFNGGERVCGRAPGGGGGGWGANSCARATLENLSPRMHEGTKDSLLHAANDMREGVMREGVGMGLVAWCH